MSEGEQCKACPIGTYNPSSGEIGATACLDCPGNFAAGLGFCIECPEGAIYNFTTTFCDDCPAGTYHIFAANTCNACPQGEYSSTARSTVCTKCGEGSFNDESGKAKCKQCPRGTYGPNVGAKSKEECVKCHVLCKECFGASSAECYSCSESPEAVMEGESTCVCPSHFFYNSATHKCEECNALCVDCFGSSSEQCEGCNTTVGFEVEGQEHLCVPYCLLLESHFASASTCKRKTSCCLSVSC